MGIQTIAIPYIYRDIRVQRVLFDLGLGQWIAHNHLIVAQIEGYDFRWTDLIQLDRSIHDARIDGPQSIALDIDCGAIDGYQLGAVRIVGAAVRLPRWIGPDRRTYLLGRIGHGDQAGRNTVFPARRCYKQPVIEHINAQGQIIFYHKVARVKKY